MTSLRKSSQPDHRLTILIALSVVISLSPYLVDFVKSLSFSYVNTEFQLVATGDVLLLEPTGADANASRSGNQDLYLLPFLFEKLPINSVNSELLQTIPGIGFELSRRIIEERENNGVYISANDLKRVSGIGVKKAEKLKKYLSFTLLQ